MIPLTTSHAYKRTYTETQKRQFPEVSFTHPEDSLMNLAERNSFIIMFLMLLCRIGPIWGCWRNLWEAETPCTWHYLFCILFWLPVSFTISHFPYVSIEHNLPSTYFFLYLLFRYTFFHSFPFYENNSKVLFSIVLFFHHNHHPFRLLQQNTWLCYFTNTRNLLTRGRYPETPSIVRVYSLPSYSGGNHPHELIIS